MLLLLKEEKTSGYHMLILIFLDLMMAILPHFVLDQTNSYFKKKLNQKEIKNIFLLFMLIYILTKLKNK